MNDDLNVLPQDKLNYKILLQTHISRCATVRDFEYLETFEKEVDDLSALMYFNIEGISFKDKIKEVQRELNLWYRDKIEVFKSKPDRSYFNPINYNMKTRPWRFMKADALYRYCIDLLAEHGALFESRQRVESWKEGDNL